MIVVDWGLLAIPNAPFIAPVFYPFAVNNVWKSGIRLGEFISWLKNETLIDLNKVHIVGFSLGSHVSGRAGNWVQEIYGQRVLRITGNYFCTYFKLRFGIPNSNEYGSYCSLRPCRP